ncbi:MAG: LptF/LptG family permease [Prevotellaceae bacterium]|nr:LptF/LptG family permease [Prevotellaceae bacterium]
MFNLRPKKLDVFLAKQFLLLFVGTFFICQFVLMMQFLWRYVDDLIGKGLSMDILAQFFWYMGLFLLPQALPLAILLSSLITFGNLGESSELTAIKASGISLMQAFRPLIVIVATIACMSFYFQNVVCPNANKSFAALLISMKQKNPELEIPEGTFYDGIPNCNVYVEKKDVERGMLYGVMIYRITNSFEDAAVIIADSGSLAMTAEKKHLQLKLYSGEWFENMRQGDAVMARNVPYRRETFWEKDILIPFDANFNLADADDFSQDAEAKGLIKILHDIDSINAKADSTGRDYYEQEKMSLYWLPKIEKKDSLKAIAEAKTEKVNLDSIFSKLTQDKKREMVGRALDKARVGTTDYEFKGYVSASVERQLRKHQLQAILKFTLSFACLIFFFIGAPLGAIVRKGGLGVPVIISVLVFIVYYIFENSGTKMAREGSWPVFFGAFLSTAILAPLAVFFTYKANKDAAVFNPDFYSMLIHKAFGIKPKRYIASKEVIIEDPDYAKDIKELNRIGNELTAYEQEHKLYRAPNVAKTFFKTETDTEIIRLSDELDGVINDLSNSRYGGILYALNRYPVINPDAHTSPFRKNWLNIATAIILPLGLFFYFRIWRFRLTLLHDIRQTVKNNELTCERIRMFAHVEEEKDLEGQDNIDNPENIESPEP